MTTATMSVSAWVGSAKKRVRRSDRKSTRLNSSHRTISYAVFCLKKKKKKKKKKIKKKKTKKKKKNKKQNKKNKKITTTQNTKCNTINKKTCRIPSLETSLYSHK